VVGGVGGGLYMAYFACAGVVAGLLCYAFTSFYPNYGGATHPWGFAYNGRSAVDSICEVIQCGRTADYDIAGNMDNSPLTFSSLRGFVGGVASLISTYLKTV